MAAHDEDPCAAIGIAYAQDRKAGAGVGPIADVVVRQRWRAGGWLPPDRSRHPVRAAARADVAGVKRRPGAAAGRFLELAILDLERARPGDGDLRVVVGPRRRDPPCGGSAGGEV